ncbi:hypothetical protein RhiirB3_435400 [Rhizophagus irregularis]|nr:hypothetical protein RhiirB3_435400 [Rhizophagus irregularis]
MKPQIKGAIGQLIIQILVQWEIPFDSPQLVASDSAAYMKKFEKINSDFTDQQSNGRIEIYLAFIQENAQQFVAVSPVFQKTCDAAYKKHVLQHPARSLFELFKFFDSRFLSLTTANRDIYFYQIIRELVNSSISLIQEWSIYININLNLIEFTE